MQFQSSELTAMASQLHSFKSHYRSGVMDSSDSLSHSLKAPLDFQNSFKRGNFRNNSTHFPKDEGYLALGSSQKQENSLGAQNQLPKDSLELHMIQKSINFQKTVQNSQEIPNFKGFGKEDPDQKMANIRKLSEIVWEQKKIPGLRIGQSPEEAEMNRLMKQVQLENQWVQQIQVSAEQKNRERQRKWEEERKIEEKMATDREELRRRYEKERKREKSIESEKQRQKSLNENQNEENEMKESRTMMNGEDKLLNEEIRKEEQKTMKEAETIQERLLPVTELLRKTEKQKENHDRNSQIQIESPVFLGLKANSTEPKRKGPRYFNSERVSSEKIRAMNDEKFQEIRQSIDELRMISLENFGRTRAQILNQAENYKTIGLFDQNHMTKTLKALDENWRVERPLLNLDSGSFGRNAAEYGSIGKGIGNFSMYKIRESQEEKQKRKRTRYEFNKKDEMKWLESESVFINSLGNPKDELGIEEILNEIDANCKRKE